MNVPRRKTGTSGSARRRSTSPRLPSDLRLEEARVAELLDIAAEVFLAHGYDGASMGEIARLSNSSKTTFYARFPAKEKLFVAVMERRMNAVFSEMSAALPMEAPPETALREYGLRLLRFALTNEQIALVRMIGMESQRFPELGKRFYQLGPQRGQALLAGYLQEQIERGRLVREDPSLMAEHLMSLISGGTVRWAVFGLQLTPRTRERQQEYVERALTVFLRAYAPRGSSAE